MLYTNYDSRQNYTTFVNISSKSDLSCNFVQLVCVKSLLYYQTDNTMLVYWFVVSEMCSYISLAFDVSFQAPSSNLAGNIWGVMVCLGILTTQICAYTYNCNIDFVTNLHKPENRYALAAKTKIRPPSAQDHELFIKRHYWLLETNSVHNSSNYIT